MKCTPLSITWKRNKMPVEAGNLSSNIRSKRPRNPPCFLSFLCRSYKNDEKRANDKIERVHGKELIYRYFSMLMSTLSFVVKKVIISDESFMREVIVTWFLKYIESC